MVYPKTFLSRASMVAVHDGRVFPDGRHAWIVVCLSKTWMAIMAPLLLRRNVASTRSHHLSAVASRVGRIETRSPDISYVSLRSSSSAAVGVGGVVVGVVGVVGVMSSGEAVAHRPPAAYVCGEKVCGPRDGGILRSAARVLAFWYQCARWYFSLFQCSNHTPARRRCHRNKTMDDLIPLLASQPLPSPSNWNSAQRVSSMAHAPSAGFKPASSGRLGLFLARGRYRRAAPTVSAYAMMRMS